MLTCSWHAVHLQFPGLLSAQRKVFIIEKLACSRSAPSPRCWASAGPTFLLDADRYLSCVSVFEGGWSWACVTCGDLCGLKTENTYTCIQARGQHNHRQANIRDQSSSNVLDFSSLPGNKIIFAISQATTMSLPKEDFNDIIRYVVESVRFRGFCIVWTSSVCLS